MENNYVANLILFIASEKTAIQANSCEMDESLTLHRMSQTLELDTGMAET
jgi:hypothetical protein